MSDIGGLSVVHAEAQTEFVRGAMLLMWKECVSEGWAPKDLDPPTETSDVIFVTAGPSAPVGCAVMYRAHYDVAWLDLLYVYPAWRGTGAGRLLMDVVQARARQWELPLVLGTGLNNRRVRDWCARLGFNEECVILRKEQP